MPRLCRPQGPGQGSNRLAAKKKNCLNFLLIFFPGYDNICSQ
jgi:hypothetical protein